MKEQPKVGSWVKWEGDNLGDDSENPHRVLRSDQDGNMTLEGLVGDNFGWKLDEWIQCAPPKKAKGPKPVTIDYKDVDPRAVEDAAALAFLDSVKATLTERAKSYPPYSEEADNISAVWSALHKDKCLSAQEVAELMLVMKLVRYSAGNTPDSLTDLVGYAARIRGMGND